MNLKPFAFVSLLTWVVLAGLACLPQGAAPTAETNPSPTVASGDGTLGGSPTPLDLEDEDVPLSDQVSGRDVLSSELTLSDEAGATTMTPPPLGALKPARGLLPSGTISVTLSLTTTVAADCRWVEEPDTPYDSMPHEFELGQGATLHSTVVRDLSDLEERRFYVRCQDRSRARDPDGSERETHLRVLGPLEGGYPRIANLWADYDRELGVGFFARYDLFIPYSWGGGANEAAAIRISNPNAKVLAYQYVTKGRPESNPLIAEWWNASPADPGYNCLLRDSGGQILMYAGHPMTNMTHSYCRALLIQQNLDAFLLSGQDQGDNLAYDGIYWDLLNGHISWLGDDIDSDLDGQPDDPAVLDAAYRVGVEEFLTEVRAHLPHAILVGNEAVPDYATWINGRIFEWHMPAVLNGADWLTWDAVHADYGDWTLRGQTPRVTTLFSAPEAIYREKHDSEFERHVPLAFQAEAAASYRRMRLGLASALLADGLFFHDLREAEAPPTWYDEFGAPSNSPARNLPPRGYLGQPTGDPFLLVEELESPNQTLNGGFEDGLNHWRFWIDAAAGAAATADIDPDGGVSGSAGVHATISSATGPGDILLSQYDRTTVAGQSYTLSFWARSEVTRTVVVRISKQHPPGTDHGVRFEALITPQWQHFHLWDEASVTADDGRLAFSMGEKTGELWLDEVQLQAGALGVWARPFEYGLAVINSTRDVQTAPLPGVYCKLRGSQAPLFQVRVDDDEAKASAGWSQGEANRKQFGATVHLAPGGSAATATYTPVLAYGGEYEVLAWVAPTTTQSSSVSVRIHHARGETVALLDETAGEVGWHSLGMYPFSAGEQGHAVLAATGSGTVVADAFKWVSTARFNDGTEVDQLTLQPQDGIVLLSSCVEPAGGIYLPAVSRD